MNKNLFSRNFIFLLIGQTLSMFGSNIIRFAISLYILDETESAAIYGTITAVSYLPSIIFSPLGGIMADRGEKKSLMVLLDVTYGVITLIMGIIFGKRGSFKLIAGLLIALSTIASVERPISSACVPLLQSKDNLMRANAFSNQISSVSGLVTPFFSGFLYGVAGANGLHYIMYLCSAFFIFSAGIELLLKIPKLQLTDYDTLAETVKCDLEDVLRLVFKDKRYIGETMFLNGLLMFLVTPYLSIGMTYLISVKLWLPAIWNGSAQLIAGIAAILGGTVAALISGKFQTKNVYKFLIVMGLSFVILTPALFGNMSPYVAFVVVSMTSAAILFMANLAGVFIISGMQKACPKNMIGRLMAFFEACNNLALPIGIWLHGIIYEKCDERLYVVFWIIAVLTMLGAARGKKVYLRLQESS